MSQNVVVNILTFEGDKKQIKKLINLIYNEKDGFKFINFSPHYDEDNKLTYNDWLIYHWGLNSDILKSELISDTEIKFETLWVTPVLGIEYLSSLSPNLKLTVKYADEDIGYNVGEYVYINGELEHEYKPEEATVEAISLSIKILDDEYHLYEYIIDLDEEEIQDGINGVDDFVSAVLKCIYEKEILTDIYPKVVQQYLLNMAVDNENYEYASKLKKII